MANQNEHTIFRKRLICSCCGLKVNDFGYQDTSIYRFMKQNDLCFTCARWVELSQNRPDNLEVIDGVAYKIFPLEENDGIYAKRVRGNNIKYVAKKDGSGIKSNQIWLVGRVPEQFVHLFPNTGWWIPEKLGKKLVRETYHCTCRGCMDRYHCFRYDYTQEFDKEPFNVVPKEWVVGEEHCSSFINITKIPNFDGYFNIEDILNEKNSVQSNRCPTCNSNPG